MTHPTSNEKALWVKPNDLHIHSPDCRATGCVDVIAWLDYERLRAVLVSVQECISHQDFMQVRCLVAGALSDDSSAPETPSSSDWIDARERMPPPDVPIVMVRRGSEQIPLWYWKSLSVETSVPLSQAHAKRILQDWIEDEAHAELLHHWPDLRAAYEALRAVADSLVETSAPIGEHLAQVLRDVSPEEAFEQKCRPAVNGGAE